MPTPLYVESAGAGPPLVLLHAGVCDSRMWDPQWTEFAATHRVVRCDLRGFGRSPVPSGAYSHAGDVIALLRDLGIERAILVGASFGGAVALEVALAAPGSVAALLLAAPALAGHEWSDDTRAFWAEEEEALERGDVEAAVEVNLRRWVDGRDRSPEAVPAGVRAFVADMQRRAFEVQAAAPADADERELVADVADRLGEIAVPTALVVGDHDQLDFEAIADRICRQVPDVRRTVLAGAAHLPNLEVPARFTELAKEFFAQVS